MISNKSVIVCAACKYEDIIITGVRHWDKIMNRHKDVLNELDRLNGKKKTCSALFEQGFIDQYGEFLSREDAMIILKASGRPFDPDRNGGDDSVLYSEGLY